MKEKYKWAIILLFIIIFCFYYKRYSHFNTQPVKSCRKDACDSFNVHRLYPDKKEAAELLHEITFRVEKLMNYIKKKYKTDKYEKLPRQYLFSRIRQMFSNYDSSRIYEISPYNITGSTSYTENKKTLVMCLRRKDNKKNLHDVNTLMFVVIHELAHMMNDKWGHDYESNFWQLFKFLLVNAMEIKVYDFIDYSKTPVVYCGLPITYTPVTDSSI